MSTENATQSDPVESLVMQSEGALKAGLDLLTCDLSDSSPVWVYLERMRREHNQLTKDACISVGGISDATIHSLFAPEVSRERVREILLQYRREYQDETEGDRM